MQFRLKAIGPGGGVESIDSQAPDETTARSQLEGRGYTVLSVRARRPLAFWQSAGERFPVTLFSQELRVLLAAGLPLVEAIETLAQKEGRGGSRAVLERIAASLRDAIRRRVVNASIYPAVLLGVGALVTIFLLVYVVPRFAHVYEERGVDLPVL